MGWFLAAVGLGICVLLASLRKVRIYGATSFFVLFNLVCLFYFYLTQYLELVPETRLSVLPIHDLAPYGAQVGQFYLMLFATAALALAATKRPAGARPHLVQNRDDILRLFPPTGARVFLIVLGALTLIHIVDFDLTYLVSYTGYHAINDPQAVGLSNPLSNFYHELGPTLAAAAAAIGVVALIAGYPMIALASLPLVLYGFALVLASGSREAAIIIAVAVAARFLLRPKLDILFWLGAGAVVLALLFALEARGAFAELGLAHLGGALARVLERGITEMLLGALSNIATGTINMAASLRIEASYDTAYKVLTTMSPLPSALDGWPNWRATNQVKITHANPFNAYAEVWAFGAPYIAFLMAQIFIVLRMLNAILFRPTSLFGLLAIALGYLWIMRLSQYGMRLDNKLLVIVTGILVLDLVLTYRRKRAKAPDRVPPSQTAAEAF